MASRFPWLSACSAGKLKAITVSTGINSTGTKPILCSRIAASLQYIKTFQLDSSPNGAKRMHRILSIDMGIRNLAYCQILVPEMQNSRLIIETWNRVDVARNRGDIEQDTGVKESFDPATYSQHAYDLITNLVLKNPIHSPQTILIERQRFRSMGGAAVQEWTLRVNMLEAMLYAVLKTLDAQGSWKGVVMPVAPSKVAKFWLNGDEKETGKEKSTKVAGKWAKINLIDDMLGAGNRFVLEGQAKAVAEGYRLRRNKTNKKAILASGGKAAHRLQSRKLDDLADCLLQGMAWVQWEKNKLLLAKEGPEALV